MSIENVSVLTADERGGAPEGEAAGGRLWLRAFADNRLAVAGLIVVIALTLFSFVGPLLYHTDQIHTRLSMETLNPGPGRPLVATVKARETTSGNSSRCTPAFDSRADQSQSFISRRATRP